MRMSFTRLVWNMLEEYDLTGHFSGTPKGMVCEVREYSAVLEKEYDKQNPRPDQIEYVRKCIKRDIING